MDLPSPDPVKDRDRVLIIFPGALGDLICLIPAIRALRRRHRGASIELMARDELARFATGRIGIDRGHSIDRREMALLFSIPGADSSEIARFFGGFQTVYCFFAWSDAGFRAALRSATRAPVSFHPFCPDGAGHVAAAYLQSVGESEETLESRIDLLPADIEAASRRLQTIGLADHKFALLIPGSGSTAKNWAAERFEELAQRLESRAPVLFVLGPAETGLGNELTAKGLRVLSNLELPELAAIAAKSALFVGNDSGPSHLAASSGAPGVVIFGPTDPERWRPLGEVTILRRQPLDFLDPGEVADTVARLLR